MATEKPSNGKAAGRTAKPPRKSGFDRDAEEAKLIKKYPSQRIVKGSLRAAGEIQGYGMKRTVEIVCQGDGKSKRRIPTSDLHQVRYSLDWLNKSKKDATAKTEKAAKKTKTRVAKKPQPALAAAQ